MSEAVNPSKKFARRRRLLAAWLLCSSLVLGFVFTDARYILPAQLPAAKALAGLVQPNPIAASEPFFAIPLRNARRLAREIAAPAQPVPAALAPEPQAAPEPGLLPPPVPAPVALSEAPVLVPTLAPIPVFTTSPPGVFSDAPPVVDPVDPEPPAVPEPATWFMLIAGFFGVGMALRRRASRALATQP